MKNPFLALFNLNLVIPNQRDSISRQRKGPDQNSEFANRSRSCFPQKKAAKGNGSPSDIIHHMGWASRRNKQASRDKADAPKTPIEPARPLKTPLKGMTREEFLKRIKSADSKLSEEGVPVYQRTFLKAYQLVRNPGEFNIPLLGVVNKSLYPDYVGPNLIDRINEWYKEIYGDKVYPNWDCGTLPVIIGNELYQMRIPMVFGEDVQFDPFLEISGLTQAMRNSLDPQETARLDSLYREGYALIYEMEDLRMLLFDPEHDPKTYTQAELILANAFEDRDTAMRCLSGIEINTNAASFHSQQLAEKMLKGLLLIKNICTAEELKSKYGHKLQKLFERCEDVWPILNSVRSHSALLSNISMEIRYSQNKLSATDAHEYVWASLKLSGIAACLITGSKRRRRNAFDGIRDMLGKYTGKVADN